MKGLKLLTLLLAFSFSSLTAQSNKITNQSVYQEGDKLIIKMKDGDIFSGVVTSQTDTELHLGTKQATITLLKAQIKKTTITKYEGEFAYGNSHDTRYFYAPTAIPLKKKKGYYQNLLLSSNFFNYGVTDNITVGGGLELISLAAGNPIFSFNTKYGKKIADNLHLGGGTLSLGFDGDFEHFGYGVITYGSSETNVTVGGMIGIDFNNDRGIFGSKVIPVTLSATHRISDRVSLISENYIIDVNWEEESIKKTNYLGIHGVRLMGRRSAFDVGLIVSSEIIDFVPFLPYIGYAFAF